MIKSLFKASLFLLALLLVYLLFYPTGLSLRSWVPPPAPLLEGDYQKNDLLSNLDILYSGMCDKCEDIAIDSSGNIYGGDIHGNIMFFEKNTTAGKVLANTGGRPLGLHFDHSGDLIIADADKGILKYSKNGTLSTVVDRYEDYVFKFADDLEIDSTGIIYFTDASSRFGFAYNQKNILENQPTGSFYSYNPSTNELSLLMDSLNFANGVAIDHNEEFVFVNETMNYQLRRYWINGIKKGQWEVMFNNLPGFPDGISRGENGIFWLTFASPRVKILDDLLPHPFLRNILYRIPESLQPSPIHYGIILGIDREGRVVYNFQDPSGKFGEITSVQQFGDKLYLGSLYENGIGVLDLTSLL